MSRAMPRLTSARIFTADIARARAFYAEAMGLEEAQADPASGFAIFRATDGVMLVVETVDETEDDGEVAAMLIGRFTGLGFAVPSVSEAFMEMRARGVRFDGLPELQPWGGTLAYFEDPDGNVLTLVEYPPE